MSQDSHCQVLGCQSRLALVKHQGFPSPKEAILAFRQAFRSRSLFGAVKCRSKSYQLTHFFPDSLKEKEGGYSGRRGSKSTIRILDPITLLWLNPKVLQIRTNIRYKAFASTHLILPYIRCTDKRPSKVYSDHSGPWSQSCIRNLNHISERTQMIIKKSSLEVYSPAQYSQVLWQ